MSSESLPLPPPSPEPFKVSSLLRQREPGAAPMIVPPEVDLWAWAASASLVTGMVTGAMRGSRLGWARAQAAIKMQGVAKHQQRALISTLMYGEMIRSSLKTGTRLGVFVACFLGRLF